LKICQKIFLPPCEKPNLPLSYVLIGIRSELFISVESDEQDLNLTGDLPWEQKFLEKVVARLVVKREKCVRESAIANNYAQGRISLLFLLLILSV